MFNKQQAISNTSKKQKTLMGKGENMTIIPFLLSIEELNNVTGGGISGGGTGFNRVTDASTGSGGTGFG